MSTQLWSASEAAQATGGKTTGSWDASGVSIDSRAVSAGDLFVAIKGPNHDGHAFVADAVARHASAAMVERDMPEVDAGLLIVPDTLDGLWALAAAARARSHARIVAITGSVGKTGTKELLASALAACGPTTASAGNLNNHYGAPLSLARLPREAAFGVFELGMNQPGEIAPLSELVKPHVALITTIEAVHTEMFDSLDAVADAKAEIFQGCLPGATVVLNQDNAYFASLSAAARSAGIENIIGFGQAEPADARLIEWTPAPAGGGRVHASIIGETVHYDIALSGIHWALNSVAALATAKAAGADLSAAANALSSVSPLKGRGARHTVNSARGTFQLIDESYNASPAAVQAAIGTLQDTAVAPGGQRIAVLGDMLELGERADEMHAALADDIRAAGIDQVFTVGALMARLGDALPNTKRGGHAARSEDIIEALTGVVAAGDVVLVKGSLGMRMAPVVEALLALADTARRA